MQIDKTSFSDISIFHQEEEFSIFHKLNFTRTVAGKEWLRKYFTEPHDDLERIIGTQRIIRTLMEHVNDWPTDISNGTILVMDKFLDYNLDPVPEKPSSFNSVMYQWLHNADYSMTKYSIPHFADFFRGLKNILVLLEELDLPKAMRIYIDRISSLLKETPFKRMAESDKTKKLTRVENLYYALHIRNR
ncbi:MAG TPA: DNA mismatch repair protein MutS, partial [Chitinophagaceae bacterium]|nr:DNA mismatch repair protein MutS [Chitinophagaceae bacterium]